MEKEKLIIRNFGPIKDVELDLGRFTILIGEQATGKSTVAKVLAVCRYFSYIVGKRGLIRESNGLFHSEATMDIPFIDGLEDWGINENLKTDSYISYTCNDYQIVFDRLHANNFSVVEIKPLSTDFLNLLLELKGFNPDYYNKIKNQQITITDRSIAIPIAYIPYNFYANNVSHVMDNPFYLPTERGLQSIFSLGKTSIQNMSDSLFNQFSELDKIARVFKAETFIEPLNIYYQNRDGHGFIRKENEKEYYSLFNAASGYQTIIPVVLTIKYYSDKNKDENRKKGKTFLIEEPELNLFPTAQNELMKYLVNSTNKYNNSMLLTTHSPYILTALNNMMYAHSIGQIDAVKTNGIIPQKYWIDPNNVSAYMMTSDGRIENILDEEIGQIKAERIDQVSTKFNKDYDDMLDIKYAGNNEG